MIIGTGIDIVEINRFKKIKDLKGIAKKSFILMNLKNLIKKLKIKLYFLQKNLRLRRLLSKRLELDLESLIT